MRLKDDRYNIEEVNPRKRFIKIIFLRAFHKGDHGSDDKKEQRKGKRRFKR